MLLLEMIFFQLLLVVLEVEKVLLVFGLQAVVVACVVFGGGLWVGVRLGWW